MYPFFDEDEEERRRRMLTPPVRLPNLPPMGPMPTTPIADPYPGISLQRNEQLRRADRRRAEMEEAKDVYGKGAPGRFKSGLLGALQGALAGMGRTGDIGGLIGGAGAGGLFGAASPRGLREMEFNQRIRPQIEERYAAEDADAQATRQAERDALDEEYKRAQIGNINRQNLPQAPRPPAPAWKLGRHNASGQFRWFDAADPKQAAGHTPHVQQPGETPIFRVDASGNYVDVRKAASEGKTVKAFQKPKAAPKPKEAQKVASIDDVREAAEQAGISTSRMKAKFIERGYRVVE